MIRDGMEESGLARPLAQKFLHNLCHAAGSRTFSVLGLYKDRDVRQVRNRYEMEFLARAIDLMRRGRYEETLEALVRRLVGVETADRSGNWKLCDAFELITEKQSFVPDDFLARALKAVKRIEAVEGSNRGTTPPHSHGSNGMSRRQHDDRYHGTNSNDHSNYRSSGDRSSSRGPPHSSNTDNSSTGKENGKGSRGQK